MKNTDPPEASGRPPRFKMGMPIKDYISQLSEGVTSAFILMLRSTIEGAQVDPDSAFGEFTPLFLLDQYGIYGEDAVTMYETVCGSDIEDFIAVLRAVQLGLLSRTVLHHALNNNGEGVCIEDVRGAVRKRLPHFGSRARV